MALKIDYRKNGSICIREPAPIEILTNELLKRNIVIIDKYMIDCERKKVYEVRDKMIGDFYPVKNPLEIIHGYLK